MASFSLPADLPRVLAAVDGIELDEHRVTLLFLAIFSAVWVTALGAAVGSFLNVVVYRLPRGMSLVRPKSRCPACGTPIRKSDNVPILGWLRLRGRCRACGSAISSRYPLVEAVTAFAFLGLAHVELFTGGANLPGGPQSTLGLEAVLWHVRPALIALFLYHATLISLAICISLITWDGFPSPKSLVGVGLLVGCVVPIVLPAAHPVGSGLPVAEMPWSVVSFAGVFLAPGTLIESGIGFLVGLTIGGVLSLSAPRKSSIADDRARVDRWGLMATGGLMGIFLGWQAVVSCGFAAAFLILGARILWRWHRTYVPGTLLLSLTLLLQLPLWRELGRLDWWPSHTGWRLLPLSVPSEAATVMAGLAAAGAASAVLAGLAGWIARESRVDG